MKKVLILCFSDLSRDPRVYRQIIALKDIYEVTTSGYNDPNIKKTSFIKLDEIRGCFLGKVAKVLYLKFGLYDKFYWSKVVFSDAYNKLKNIDFDLILANDSDALPLSVRLAKEKGVKLIYDAHEYTPKEFESNFKWRFLWQNYRTYLCQKYLSQVDQMLTVCDGIRNEYYREFNVLPTVITNAPGYQKLTYTTHINSIIKIVHHGVAIKERNLELMIDTAKLLDDRFQLNFMLIASDLDYLAMLKNRAADCSRIKFIEPVPMPEIPNFINQFDIGLFILPENGFNYKYALPNKFFEFIQGRLMVAIGPSIEMAKIVKKYNIGVVADDFSAGAMANLLNKLTYDDIINYKQNSSKCAKEFSADKNQLILLDLVNNLLSS